MAQDSGFVISVPQITFTDSAKSYIGRKDYKTRTLHLPHCIAGVLKNPWSQIGAKSGARNTVGFVVKFVIEGAMEK